MARALGRAIKEGVDWTLIRKEDNGCVLYVVGRSLEAKRRSVNVGSYAQAFRIASSASKGRLIGTTSPKKEFRTRMASSEKSLSPRFPWRWDCLLSITCSFHIVQMFLILTLRILRASAVAPWAARGFADILVSEPRLSFCLFSCAWRFILLRGQGGNSGRTTTRVSTSDSTFSTGASEGDAASHLTWWDWFWSVLTRQRPPPHEIPTPERDGCVGTVECLVAVSVRVGHGAKFWLAAAGIVV